MNEYEAAIKDLESRLGQVGLTGGTEANNQPNWYVRAGGVHVNAKSFIKAYRMLKAAEEAGRED